MAADTQSLSGRTRCTSHPPGFDLLISRPIVRSYTDGAVPVREVVLDTVTIRDKDSIAVCCVVYIARGIDAQRTADSLFWGQFLACGSRFSR